MPDQGHFPGHYSGQHTDVRRTRAWRRLVSWAKLNLPWTCHLCGQRIPTSVSQFHPLAYELDHKLTVRDYPELALSPDNVAPSHRRCNAWRKARPLSVGLLIECAERFAARPPAALRFFGESPVSQEKPQANGDGG